MQRLITIFLISLTFLTFSNTASGGFFGDVFEAFFGDTFTGGSNKVFPSTTYSMEEPTNVRCKIEYTQLDLNTGIEKYVKYTVQQEIKYIARGSNSMYLSTQDLTDKLNDWMKESKENIIVSMTGINCKDRTVLFLAVNPLLIGQYWGEYKSCEDKYNVELMNLLDYPDQWGYNVHKDRLIKEHEEGCNTHYGDYSDG
jgi:hypothetical protein